MAYFEVFFFFLGARVGALPFRQSSCLTFDFCSFPQMFFLSRRKEKVVMGFIQHLGDIPEMLFRGYPIRSKSFQRKWPRIAPEGLFPSTREDILVEIREGQLTKRSVNRISVTKHGMVTLTDSTPKPIVFKESHHMINIWPLGFEIHKEWLLALKHKCRGSDKGSFNTVSPTLTECHPWRRTRIAVLGKITRKSIQEVLNLFWCIQFLKYRKLFWRKSKHRNYAAGGVGVTCFPSCTIRMERIKIEMIIAVHMRQRRQ